MEDKLFMSFYYIKGVYMAKEKSLFFCTACGCEQSKWSGQCPECKEWNTMVEAPKSMTKGGHVSMNSLADVKAYAIDEISASEAQRTPTGFGELDRVLGGGIVDSSLVLVGGDPGIGKSTLLLQLCHNLSEAGKQILYISGEESLTQIKLRADRIGHFNSGMKLLCENDLGLVEGTIERIKPELVIVDSIQTMYTPDIPGTAGSVSQVREATNRFLRISKGLGITVFIIGHVTKDGAVAGPKLLEHMVDTVLYFEGDRNALYRIIRAVKNRFGSTDEIGMFRMQREGLEEVLNPSAYMLEGRSEDASGCCVTCVMEGTRPILAEIQALVCKTNFAMPRRTTNGTDFNRVNILMAVLEKKAGLELYNQDAYINVVGGMKFNDTGTDLAILAAIVSSLTGKVIPKDTLILGEVGLAGEVRNVSYISARVSEAAKLGFTTCIIPKSSLSAIEDKTKVKLVGISNIGEIMRFFK